MYAVIFRAKVAELDEEYSQVAGRMRALAMEKYGCKEFASITNGDEEISISYWDNLDQIKAWKKDAEHVMAQKLGRSKWYKSYKVQVADIVRKYESNT